MKFTKTVIKNIKLLMRAKSSAFIVIFGPLIIILLVGLALNKPSTYALDIGYHSPTSNNLTASFIDEMKNLDYFVTEYTTTEECIKAIEQSTSHTCIIFPEHFEIGKDGANKLEFYVDYSRTNLVYKIIEDLTNALKLRTSELSKDLTQTVLTKIDDSKKDIDDYILSMITIKSTIDSIVSDIDVTKDKTGEFETAIKDVSFSELEARGFDLYDDARDLKNLGLEAVDEGLDIASSNSSISTFKNIEEEIKEIYNISSETYDIFEGMAGNLSDMIDTAQNSNDEIVTRLDNVQTSLGDLKEDTNKVKGGLESTVSNLQNIDITSAESIVSPIKTEIKPIVSQSNQLIFMFPYLLVLVIMFIGIMLSSALIIMEKNSKAAFRNFTTPTNERFFVITTYVTSFIILFAQLLIILILSYFFLEIEQLSNLGITSIILLITMSMFILVGMIIGYISKTQEASTMFSITIVSVFLLISNLMLPIETMSEFMKNLTRFNPYVVSSELLRKTFLFDTPFLDIIHDVLFLFAIMVVLIIVTFTVNKLSKIRLIEKTHYFQRKGLIYVPEDAYLKMDKYVVKNKKDIFKVLQQMTKEEFEKHVNKEHNEIANWVSLILKDKSLAFKLRSRNRDKMLKVMKNVLKKEEKKALKKKKKIEKRMAKREL